jgi:hypothetical protein
MRPRLCLLLLAVPAASAFGQTRHPEIVPRGWLDRRDPVAVDPAHYRLDFENEHVRAIRLALRANEARREPLVPWRYALHLQLGRAPHGNALHRGEGRE